MKSSTTLDELDNLEGQDNLEYFEDDEEQDLNLGLDSDECSVIEKGQGQGRQMNLGSVAGHSVAFGTILASAVYSPFNKIATVIISIATIVIILLLKELILTLV